jgi:hypothetical protein
MSEWRPGAGAPRDDVEPPRLAPAEKATNPIAEHLGARPSRWAVAFLWVSVAAFAIALALLVTTFIG